MKAYFRAVRVFARAAGVGYDGAFNLTETLLLTARSCSTCA